MAKTDENIENISLIRHLAFFGMKEDQMIWWRKGDLINKFCLKPQ